MKSLKLKKSPLSQYQFHIDTVTPEVISGWAFNPNEPSAAPVIEVRSGDTVLWQAKAELPRKDLKEAGFGDAAFSIYPNLLAIKENIEHIDIYIDGHKANESAYDMVATVPNIEQYQCFIDHVSETQISGWAHYQDLPNHKPAITVRSGEIVLGEGRADQARQDLIDANIGDGHYAFTVALNLTGLKAGANPCQIYLDGHPAPIAPIEINISAQTISQAALSEFISGELGQFEQVLANTTAELHQQIESYSQGQPASLNTVANVAISQLAHVTARLQVIESAVTKLIEKKQ